MAQRSDDLVLRISYWLAVHRDQLRTWWAISILSVDVILLIVFVVSFAAYSFGTPSTVRSVAAMSATLVPPQVRLRISPAPLEVGSPVAIAVGTDKYDLAAPVKNPNEHFLAREVRFRFRLGDEVREGTTTVWPGQQSYFLVANAVVRQAVNRKPEFEVLDVVWQRPEDRTIFSALPFTDREFSLNPVAGLPGGLGTKFSVQLKNSSVYNLRQATFLVAVERQGVPVAVGNVQLESFLSFQERLVEYTWQLPVPVDGTSRIIPTFNPLVPNAFL